MSERLKLKESVSILKESEDIYHVLFTATRRIKKFRVDGLVKEVISKLNLEQVESEFVNELSNNYDVENIRSCLKALEYEGILRRYNGELIDERNSKQILFIDE